MTVSDRLRSSYKSIRYSTETRKATYEINNMDRIHLKNGEENISQGARIEVFVVVKIQVVVWVLTP
jgi:hypothetical protein